MTPYKLDAHIHSLNGEIREVTVLAIDTESDSCSVYTVEYNGIKCKARFNPFVCMLYADDKYEIIKEKQL